MVLGALIHVMVLPFLDLTLIAVNATIGIIFSVLLARIVLQEQFIPKYDLSGLTFISVGCMMIVLNANKVEQSFTGEQAYNLLISGTMLTYVVSSFAFFGLNLCVLNKFTNSLRRFEADVDAVQDTAARFANMSETSSTVTNVLPPREKLQRNPDTAHEESLLTQDNILQRPARILIDAVNDLPVETVLRLSPQS